MKCARGIEYHQGRDVLGNASEMGVRTENEKVNILEKKKARICHAKSAFVRPYPAKPESAEHTGRIRLCRIGCDYKKISQKV